MCFGGHIQLLQKNPDKEVIIKEKDFVDDENNNTKQNSDHIEASK